MSKSLFSVLILLLPYTILASPHSTEDFDEPITSFPGETIYTLKVPTLEENNFDNLLSFGHYQKSCPQFESILNRKVQEWIHKDYTLAASLLRLHFHDCSIRVIKLVTIYSSLPMCLVLILCKVCSFTQLGYIHAGM